MRFENRTLGYQILFVVFIAMIGLIAFAFVLTNGQVVTAQETTPEPTPENTAQTRTLSVTGTGSASGSPDVARIDVGVEVENTHVAAAVEEVDQRMNDVIAALNEIGIPSEDIRTTNYSIRQQQAPPAPNDSQDSTQDTYIVSNTAEVRVMEIDRMSEVIQTALDAGANRMYGLRFGLEDPDTLLSEARQEAADDARARAEELAQIFGVSLGAPLQIDEAGSSGQPVAAAPIGGGGGATISEGQLSVTIRLNVTYEIAGPSE